MRFALTAVALAFAGTVLALHPGAPGRASAAPQTGAARLERGRFLIAYGGCNDCHTPGYGEHGGQVPQSQWLVGSTVGFRGPWGTTYPANLRLMVAHMSAAQWIKLARTGRMRPPMPFWALHVLDDRDLHAMYAFVKSLGPAGAEAPAYVPPGKQPSTPWIYFAPVTR